MIGSVVNTSTMIAQDLHPALLWVPLTKGAVRCDLCAHHCKVKPDKAGICRVRINRGGDLYTRVYGMATSLAVDPVEKKPLFHFYPGSRALSLATVGCNFACHHCQNHSISWWGKGTKKDEPVPGRFISPTQAVEAAMESDSQIIAYTYTEPTIYMEYALDTARLAAKQGIHNVFVTNGYMTDQAVALIAPYLHGANVDLKGTDDRVLKREVKAESAPVMRTIEDLHRRGIWVEVTTLIIPGSNDDDEQLQQISAFIAGISPNIPWHVSRFHPTFKRLDRPATPTSTLHRAVEIGRRAGLNYVFAGNVWGDDSETSHCPACGAAVITRHGFAIQEVAMKGGRCRGCGARIDGRGMP